MCGICGILALDTSRVEFATLDCMLAAIRHRGPDEAGVFIDRQIGLGHARLSIIDLSGGHQPMANHDETVCITFNGEIFNYIELREELIRKGHRFETSSDTEVLLRLYEQQGEDCVRQLNGQWAFAIWDSKKKALFLSRDRMGVRPLYYCRVGHHFLFGSEIKSIFAHPEVPRELDAHGLQQVMTLWHTVPPRTAFAEICELPPGHSLSIRNGEIRTRQYWRINFDPDGGDRKLNENEAAEELGAVLIDATRLRLRADVPVGAYLSGGLDSSLITALIRRFTSAPLETFSVAFEDAEYDESECQQQVADHLGTTHHRLLCTHADIGEAFPDAVWAAEKPLLRAAPAPMYLLSGLVRRSGFKVVLTGEGSDEIMGGYDIYKETKIRSFWAAQPDSLLRPLLLRRLYPYMPQMQRQSPEYLKLFFRIRPEDRKNPFFSHLPRWEMSERLRLLFSTEFIERLGTAKPWSELSDQLPPAFASWDPFQRAQYLEAAYLMPGYILSSQGDRPAMAHAVEGRFPFLDCRVVEFACRLPVSFKMRGLREKYLLKRFAAKMLPPAIVQRPKQPYRAPEVRSFLDEDGKPRHNYIEELLSPDVVHEYGLFDRSAVRALLNRLAKNPGVATVRDSMALAAVLSTQLLTHQFIRNPISGRNNGHASPDSACLHH